jgi:predicted small lipoprotein YifL
MLKSMTLLLATFALSACQHTQPKVIPDSSCVAFQVIRPSREDTAGTKRQVLAHNQTYRKICGSSQQS